MLLWIEKPSQYECERSHCGARKFFCGRKHKYGLNLQGTCDSEGRFLDVSICHPASTSDFLSYSTSKLSKKLESAGFLAPGLVIFGDSAYVNCSYFVTPYKAVKSGSKDDFNYYHSQVRIKIECAFGMLVARWSILRKPLPSSMGLSKTTALTMCLCRLHNFCIDCRLIAEAKGRSGSSRKKRRRVNSDHQDIAEPLAQDRLELMGGIPLERHAFNDASPEDLLHGGHHFDDAPESLRQAFVRQARSVNRHAEDPREKLRRQVERMQLSRPTPKAWQELVPSST